MKADLYTVMLATALLAVLISLLGLLLELQSYHFDIKAKTGKAAAQQVSWAAQFGPAITRATACPIAVRLSSSAAGLLERRGSPRITSNGQAGSGCS